MTEPLPVIKPSAIVDAARNFQVCMSWCLSHWLTAKDHEESRQFAASEDDAEGVSHYAEKCESYEKQRDRYWHSARSSAFILIGAARAWGLPCNKLRALLTTLHHTYLPSVCGVDPKNCLPPNFEPAETEAASIGEEAEIRSSIEDCTVQSQTYSVPEMPVKCHMEARNEHVDESGIASTRGLSSATLDDSTDPQIALERYTAERNRQLLERLKQEVKASDAELEAWRRDDPAWQALQSDPKYIELLNKVDETLRATQGELPDNWMNQLPQRDWLYEMAALKQGYGVDDRQLWERADTPERFLQYLDNGFGLLLEIAERQGEGFERLAHEAWTTARNLEEKYRYGPPPQAPENPQSKQAVERYLFQLADWAKGWAKRRAELAKTAVQRLAGVWEATRAAIDHHNNIGAIATAKMEQVFQEVSGDVAVMNPDVPDGFYSSRDIAKAMNVPNKADAIRKALERLMRQDLIPGNGWMENRDPARGQTKFLFRLSEVRPLLRKYESGQLG